MITIRRHSSPRAGKPSSIATRAALQLRARCLFRGRHSTSAQPRIGPQKGTHTITFSPQLFPLSPGCFGLATSHVALPGLTVSVSHQQFWFNCDQVAVRGQTSYVLSQSTNRDRYQHYLSDLSFYVLKCKFQELSQHALRLPLQRF